MAAGTAGVGWTLVTSGAPLPGGTTTWGAPVIGEANSPPWVAC